MGYALVRLFLAVWWVGLLMALIYSVSTLFWGKGAFGKRAKRALFRANYGLIWPIAIMTERGRDRFFSVMFDSDQGDWT